MLYFAMIFSDPGRIKNNKSKPSLIIELLERYRNDRICVECI